MTLFCTLSTLQQWQTHSFRINPGLLPTQIFFFWWENFHFRWQDPQTSQFNPSSRVPNYFGTIWVLFGSYLVLFLSCFGPVLVLFRSCFCPVFWFVLVLILVLFWSLFGPFLVPFWFLYCSFLTQFCSIFVLFCPFLSLFVLFCPFLLIFGLYFGRNKNFVSGQTFWIFPRLYKFTCLHNLHLAKVSHRFRQNIANFRKFFDSFEPFSQNEAAVLVRKTTCSFSVFPNPAHSLLSSGKIKARKFK